MAHSLNRRDFVKTSIVGLAGAISPEVGAPKQRGVAPWHPAGAFVTDRILGNEKAYFYGTTELG